MVYALLAMKLNWYREIERMAAEIKRLRSEVGLITKRYRGAQNEVQVMVTRLQAQPPLPIPPRDEAFCEDVVPTPPPAPPPPPPPPPPTPPPPTPSPDEDEAIDVVMKEPWSSSPKGPKRWEGNGRKRSVGGTKRTTIIPPPREKGVEKDRKEVEWKETEEDWKERIRTLYKTQDRERDLDGWNQTYDRWQKVLNKLPKEEFAFFIECQERRLK